MSYSTLDFTRSISKKQVVAVTGFLLIVFVIAHLAGNLLIYFGAEVFNGYSEHLNQLGWIKNIFEWGLFFIFLIHIVMTAWVVVENIKARGLSRYSVDDSKRPRSLATRLMPYSGTFLIIYLIYHLYDFTWASHQGARTLIEGKSLGLYGLVINSFKDPVHSGFYIMAMGFLALHLAHGTQSFMQTLGFNDSRFTPRLRKFSEYFAFVIMVSYASIPLYVLYLLK